MSRLLLLAPLLAACGDKAPPKAGGEAELPPAEQLYDNYVTLTSQGNEGALAEVESSYMLMRMSIPAQSMEADIESWWMSPSLTRTDMEIPGVGHISQGYDGAVGWSLDPMMGPRVLDGDELAQMVFSAEMMADADWRARYESVETLSLEDFEGAQAWKVRAVPAGWDTEIFMFFDAQSGLLVGQEQKASTAMGRLKTTTVMAEYTDFGGVLMPRVMTSRTLGMEQVLTVESYTLNPEVLPDFGPPPEIQALLDEAAGVEPAEPVEGPPDEPTAPVEIDSGD